MADTLISGLIQEVLTGSAVEHVLDMSGGPILSPKHLVSSYPEALTALHATQAGKASEAPKDVESCGDPVSFPG